MSSRPGLPDLPIVSVLPALKAALRNHSCLVLRAPPGAGKSTVVPLELLNEPWLRGRRIVVLEPRRLAARAVAARMAATLGEAVGRTVGYRMRLDTRVSASTRIEVVTEGVLASLLHRDPALEDVGCVIFDEFHERSLQADLGLALCLDVQGSLNEELRLLVMSATVDVEGVSRVMDGAEVVEAQGRSFEVEVRYAGKVDERDLNRAVGSTVLRALKEEEGDLLVFLPGAPEIRRVQGFLEQAGLERNVRVAPLYGELGQKDQNLALERSPPGMRKVVLATNIAETSLTIEGVRVVVDAGMARRSRFNPVSGMSGLETARISRASAEQRCGRAGRLEPGVCYRLWSEGMQASMEAHTPAEILETDLAPLALELAGWNVSDPAQLRWIDLPPTAAFAQARELLKGLRALDEQNRITKHGRQMLELRVHPRLAHMLLKGRELGLGKVACDVAAVLGERDVLRGRERDADLRTRLEALTGQKIDAEIDRNAVERVRRTAKMYRHLGSPLHTMERKGPTTWEGEDTDEDSLSLQRREAGVRISDEGEDISRVGLLLALAYPDRIARARGGTSGRYLLSNGRGAFFAEPQALARSEFLAIAELDAGEREARIFMAAPVSVEALEEIFSERIQTIERVEWDSQAQVVIAQQERRLGALVLEQAALRRMDSEVVKTAMIEGLKQMGLDVLPWDKELRTWQARVQFVGNLDPQNKDNNKEWPDVSDAALLSTMDQWLAPFLDGVSRRDHLTRVDLRAALEAMLEWKQKQRLDELAPPHVVVPSGSSIPIDYLDGDVPSLSVKLQEMFGMSESPRIGGGKVSLLIKLLSPARRPVQVTRDLASFWRTGYAEVRKELKGRYPRHYWPEDPYQAEAVRGVRRKNI